MKNGRSDSSFRGQAEVPSALGAEDEIPQGVPAASCCPTVFCSSRAGATLRIDHVLKYGGKITTCGASDAAQTGPGLRLDGWLFFWSTLLCLLDSGRKLNLEMVLERGSSDGDTVVAWFPECATPV